MSDLSALSVAPSCLQIQGDGSLAVLRPSLVFMPKIITGLFFRSRVITLEGFFPPPHTSEEEATSHLLRPVRALSCYTACVAQFPASVCALQRALNRAASVCTTPVTRAV